MSASEGAMRTQAGTSALGGLPLRGAYANPATSLVGRDREVTEVTALLEQARLVTLTGPGGTGKTRLSLAVAQSEIDGGGDFTFVDLAPLEDAALLPVAIASSLGLRATDDQHPMELVTRRIGDERRSLLLDNMEHIPAASPMVAELLSRCPRLRVLTTSRVPLRLSMERTYEVSALPVPSHSATAESLERSDSVALFIERARAATPDLDLAEESLATIAEICRRVEGLPLAIELAAARTRHMPLLALLVRLEHPLPLLEGGPADAPERHRTLRHTIAWSYELLDEPATIIFGRLGVFSGTFGLAAAHDVAGHEVSASESGSLNVLGDLVDHSLLYPASMGGSEPRFAMHEMIREFAMTVVDDETAARGRHAAFFLGLAEEADAELEGQDQVRWAQALLREVENLRAALGWMHLSADSGRLLSLTAALGGFWRLQGDLREGSDWLARALSSHGPHDEYVRVRARWRFARILALLGERDKALAAYETARTSAEAVNDTAGLVESLAGIGMLRLKLGRTEDAFAPIDEALAVAKEDGRSEVLGPALVAWASLRGATGRVGEAAPIYSEAIEHARASGNARLAAVAMMNLAGWHLSEGDHETAAALLTDAVDHLSEIEDAGNLAFAYLVLGLARTQLEDTEGARRAIDRGARLALDGAEAEGHILATEVIANWLGAAGAPRDALRAWASADHARLVQDIPIEPIDHSWIDPALARDRARVSESAAARAWAEGRGTDLDTATVDGLIAMKAAAPSAVIAEPGQRDRFALTPREREVLVLLAEGHRDGEIAEMLFISPKTASVHAANIKGKLGASSRVEIVTMAIRMGLVEPPGLD